MAMTWRDNHMQSRGGYLGALTLVLLLPLAIALAGCGKSASADGYTFGKAEWIRTDSKISFVIHPSAKALQAAFPGGKGTDKLAAWSLIRGDTCIVHIIDPAVSYEPEYIGHEITHCVYGRWHS